MGCRPYGTGLNAYDVKLQVYVFGTELKSVSQILKTQSENTVALVVTAVGFRV